MTRKDYKMIASSIAATRRQWEADPTAQTAVLQSAVMLAEVLKQDNPCFDPGRFLEACRA